MKVLSQLTTPLRYLQIRNAEKRVVDSYVPIGLGVLSLIVILGMSTPPLLGANGLVGMVNQLFQVLVGFYVASLAAVATFNNPSLDQPVIGVQFNGEPIKRRVFLCYLFGHLSLMSFLLYIGGIVASMAVTELHRTAETLPWARWLCITAYSAIFWHIFVVTLLGLHYLIDRAQRSDPVITSGPRDIKKAEVDRAA